MSLLKEFPTYRECPRNALTRTDWLAEKLGEAFEKIAGLEARLAVGGPAKAATSQVGRPAEGVKELDLNQYPGMSAGGRSKVLEEHFRTLGGEPSFETCLHYMRFFREPCTNQMLAAVTGKTKEQAIAITYILKKRGWLTWSDCPKGLVKTEAAPEQCTPAGNDAPSASSGVNPS